MAISLQEFMVLVGQVIGPRPFCVETGASYTRLPENETNLKHTSTYNIVWHIAEPNDGLLWTYDNQQESLNICQQVLGSDNAHWRGILGDSVENLQSSVFPKSIDFVHLDSVEGDEDYMVREFLAIEPYLSPNAIVCCDDIHNPSSVKWKKAVPLLKTKAHSYVELPTGLGTFVGFMGDLQIDLTGYIYDPRI